ERDQDVPLPDLPWMALSAPADGRELTGSRLDDALVKPVVEITRRLRESWNARPKIYVAQVRDEARVQSWRVLGDGLQEEGFAVLPHQKVFTDRTPDSKIQ